jgi:hypothetical protein
VLNVDGEDDPILVVVIPAEVGREAVATDFMALQFALGRPLVLETLVGTDADLKPVSAMGLRLGVRGTGGHRCPVPERLDTTIQWQAALFQRVAQAQCGQGVDTLTVPLGAYLDGIASHIDLAYLAAQVGLEAFATRIVRDVARQPIVKSSSEWLRWVKANEDAISEHAVDADAARKLLGKINNAHHGATGERVEAALRLHQLAVPEEVVEEIRRRSRSVHGYVMAGVGGERDIIKDVDRRDIVLTLLAALVAKHVGFDGPIVGWARDERGNPAVPAWWPHRGLAAPSVRFLCERNV